MKIRSKVQGVFFCITLTLLLLTNGLFYFSAKRNLTQQILIHELAGVVRKVLDEK
jgi:hypothetical protein